MSIASLICEVFTYTLLPCLLLHITIDFLENSTIVTASLSLLSIPTNYLGRSSPSWSLSTAFFIKALKSSSCIFMKYFSTGSVDCSYPIYYIHQDSSEMNEDIIVIDDGDDMTGTMGSCELATSSPAITTAHWVC